jgi:hypothetical protein
MKKNSFSIIFIKFCFLSQLLHKLLCKSELRYLDYVNRDKFIKTQKAKFNGPICLGDKDCSFRGKCNLETGICLCDYEYDTVYPYSKYPIFFNGTTKTSNSTNTVNLTSNEFQYCNYKRKYQLTAFMLSMFVGFGSEHFYLERYSPAIGKLVFYMICFTVNIAYLIVYKCCPNGKKHMQFLGFFEAFYLVCGVVTVILWNVYDLVNIGYDDFLDGNDKPMIPWNTTNN